MYIFGVDPGKTTGVVVTELNDDGLHFIDSVQLVGFHNTISDLMLIYTARNDRLMICEAFISFNTPFHADANWSVQLIGALRWQLEGILGEELVIQNPQARLFITDNMLRKLGFWIKGEEHSRQAMKHVLTYCIKTLRHPVLMQQLRDAGESV